MTNLERFGSAMWWIAIATIFVGTIAYGFVSDMYSTNDREEFRKPLRKAIKIGIVLGIVGLLVLTGLTK